MLDHPLVSRSYTLLLARAHHSKTENMVAANALLEVAICMQSTPAHSAQEHGRLQAQGVKWVVCP